MQWKALVGAKYVWSLVVATAISCGLLVADRFLYHDLIPTYMLWNLFLAWVPFGLILWLQRTLECKSWSSWEGLLVSAAWLGFLPNSFYMISDFIHLVDFSNPDQLLYSTVLFTSFIATGVVLGFSSLYLVHRQLCQRLTRPFPMGLIALILAVCSVAIYIGRDLRWNTWDLLTDPAGLLFDISERLLHPTQYGAMLAVIVPFFVLLLGMYSVVWQAAQRLQAVEGRGPKGRRGHR